MEPDYKQLLKDVLNIPKKEIEESTLNPWIRKYSNVKLYRVPIEHKLCADYYLVGKSNIIYDVFKRLAESDFSRWLIYNLTYEDNVKLLSLLELDNYRFLQHSIKVCTKYDYADLSGLEELANKSVEECRALLLNDVKYKENLKQVMAFMVEYSSAVIDYESLINILIEYNTMDKFITNYYQALIKLPNDMVIIKLTFFPKY